MQAFAGYTEKGDYVPGTLRDTQVQSIAQLSAMTGLNQQKLAKLGYYVRELKVGVTLDVTDDETAGDAPVQAELPESRKTDEIATEG